MSEEDFIGGILIGGLIMFIVMGTCVWLSISNYESLSQETANDICVNLTNNTASEGHSENGKLICSVPSYDHTQNIIIKGNSEE